MSKILGQDILLAVTLLKFQANWTFGMLGKSILISASQCHASYNRLVESHLIDHAQKVTIKGNLCEFLIHGVKYVFPVSPKEKTIGIPTAHSAPILKNALLATQADKIVWPHPDGKIEGNAISPIYKTVPELVQSDPWLYGVMSLIDSLRIGHAREREVAGKLLKDLIYDLKVSRK